MIKDVFARNEAALGPPTTQSVSLGLRRDWDLTSKTNFQIDYQTRELWIQSHTRQADLLPAINISHVVSPSCVAYVGGLLQLRSNYFGQGGTREIDPFYSGGIVYRRGDWVFVASDTLVTNFRRQSDIVPLGACNMVADFEVFRPVNQRVAPGLVYFTRVEPIFNWSDHKIEGQSGIDVRIYNGFRFNMTKPAYHQTMETLRKQIQEAEDEDEASRKKNAPAPAAPGGTAPATTPSIIPSIQVEPNPAAPGTGPVPSPSN